MRLLIINCVSDRSELGLYKGLVSAGVEVELICDPRETRQQELRAFGIPTTPLHIRSRVDLSAVRFVRDKLGSRHFDLVYAPTSRGISTALMASRGTAIKNVTYRGTLGNMSILNPTSLLAHRNNRVDSIVCNCDAVRDFLGSLGIPSSRLHTIYKGHSLDWYAKYPRADLSNLSIPAGSFVIGCLANIRPLKGIDTLLKSLTYLPEELLVRLLIIGDMPDKSVLRKAQQLQVHHKVRFLGFRDDALSYVRACDLTVMPSIRREGVPRALLESMAMGIPAVVTDVGGMPEVVQHRATGLVVDPGNPRQLADAFSFCVRDLAFLKSAGLCGRRVVEKRFSERVYVNAFLQLFTELTGRTWITPSVERIVEVEQPLPLI